MLFSNNRFFRSVSFKFSRPTCVIQYLRLRYQVSAFLPAAGYRGYDNGQLYNRGYYGVYWSSIQDGSHGCYMDFYNGNTVRTNNTNRSFGFSVRCVAVLKIESINSRTRIGLWCGNRRELKVKSSRFKTCNL